MIGSLHTMSYLEPHDFFKKIIVWLLRTQKVDIKEQYEKYNVRAFDLHLYFVGSRQKAVFKYKNIEYETFSVYKILNYLNSKGNAYVRIVLEDNGEFITPKDRLCLERRFIDYCKIIEQIYERIIFFGGYREFDFKTLYDFGNDIPENIFFYERVDKLK